MKIASIVDAIKAYSESGRTPRVEYRLVHTGQHYDEKMSHSFFRDLGLPEPSVDLGVGSASHAVQTAEIMKRFEPALVKAQPDVVLVVGDVNSTIACTLVASKIEYLQANGSGRRRPLLAHVEAGLRSFDRAMPEEINRILTDAISDLLFTTEAQAVEQLVREGIPLARIHFVGNTMVDTLLKHREKAQQSTILAQLGLSVAGLGAQGTQNGENRQGVLTKGAVRPYAVATLHRPSNVDEPDTFRGILDALSMIGKNVPIIFPVHPRTASRIREFRLGRMVEFTPVDSGVPTGGAGIRCVDPLGYLDFLCLTANAAVVLTDSGGIQEETTVLGVPCVTLRENTERPVTITHGTNVLVGIKPKDIVAGALRKLKDRKPRGIPDLWDGKAGERIIDILTERVT